MKVHFKNKGNIKIFPDKSKLKEYVTNMSSSINAHLNIFNKKESLKFKNNVEEKLAIILINLN
jgi:hypothetical protein